MPSDATDSNTYNGCRTIRYGPEVTNLLASAITLNDRPKCARAKTERPVPTRLRKLAITVCVNERLARGKRVTRVIVKVPTIAKALGSNPFAFWIGSSLTMNKIVSRPRNRMVEDRDTTSAKNLHDDPASNAWRLSINASVSLTLWTKTIR